MHIEKKTLKNIFLGVGACIILYWLLHETESVKNFFSKIYGVISPFVLGAGLAFFFNVPMRAIEGALSKVKSVRPRRVLAIALTMLLVLLLLALVFYLLIPQLVNTIQDLIPEAKNFFSELEVKAEQYLSENPILKDWFTKNTDIEDLNWASIAEKALSVIGNSLSTIVSSVFVAISNVTDVLVNVVIAIVFAVYCLCHKETLSRQGKKLLYAFLPESFADKTIRIVKLTNATFSDFLSGQCIEVCILGSMFAICMWIFGMPYIPLVSVLIAVTAFIPVVGAWVGCVCGTFLILVEDPIQAVIFLVMFVILQLIENNVIYPRVVGTSIGLSGMWVLVAVAVGGELFGVAGMFLMIPFAAVIHTLLREITDKKLQNKTIDSQKLIPEVPIRSPKKKRFEKRSMKITQEDEKQDESQQ